jgi:hypothetical protein
MAGRIAVPSPLQHREVLLDEIAHEFLRDPAFGSELDELLAARTPDAD